MNKNYKAAPYNVTIHHEAIVDKNEPWNDTPAYDTHETRFRIVSTDTGEILDDAQGYGYRTAQKAYSAYAYKTRDKSKDKEKGKKEAEIKKWMKEHKGFVNLMDEIAFEILKGSWGPGEKFDAKFLAEMLKENNLEVNFKNPHGNSRLLVSEMKVRNLFFFTTDFGCKERPVRVKYCMNRAIKIRIYPNAEQIVLLKKTFGCCRKVWNLMLSDKIEYYKQYGKKLQTTPANYKESFSFLKEVDSLALANVQINLQQAYNNFFRDKKVGFPKFKSKKRTKKSYTTNNINDNIVLSETSIKLPKIGTVKAKVHRLPKDDWKLKSVTVSKSSDGKYYASILFGFEQHVEPVSIYSNNSIGLDYKSDGLYKDSHKNPCDMPHYFRLSQKKLAKEQRKLARKVGNHKNETKSNNWYKQRLKVNKIYSHVSNQRKDFLHKKSTEIANQFDIVCIETLDMKAMSNKGFGNGKATMDNGFGMFQNMLEYKLADRGKYLVKVDKWFPSSQLCHVCGYKNPEVKDLRIREWTCPQCGTVHDRDDNAAINIEIEGLRILRNM